MSAIVHRNYIKYNNYRYYKGRAQSIELGDWGDKRTPATRANYVDQKGNIGSLIRDVRVTPFKLTQRSGNKARVIGNFSMALFGVDGNDFYADALAGKWEFVEIHLRNEARFLSRLNRAGARLERLKSKDSYRLVDSIIVVMRGAEVRKLRMGHNGAFNMQWNGIGLKINDSNRTARDTVFEIHPNTVYAYGLKKLKWDANRKNRRTRVVDLVDDPHGV